MIGFKSGPTPSQPVIWIARRFVVDEIIQIAGLVKIHFLQVKRIVVGEHLFREARRPFLQVREDRIELAALKNPAILEQGVVGHTAGKSAALSKVNLVLFIIYRKILGRGTAYYRQEPNNDGQELAFIHGKMNSLKSC